jgi:hypothetical protein
MFRLLPIKAFNARLNYIVRLGLRKCEDGKYRIYRSVALPFLLLHFFSSVFKLISMQKTLSNF